MVIRCQLRITLLTIFLTVAKVVYVIPTYSITLLEMQLHESNSREDLQYLLDKRPEWLEGTEISVENKEKRRNILTQFLMLKPIEFYQTFISSQDAPGCNYYPSCSHFMIQSIENYGSLKGFLLGSDRILRCNPLSKKYYYWDSNKKKFIDPIDSYNFNTK